MQNAPGQQSRQDNFYRFLAAVMGQKRVPLPPDITGIPNTAYDPATSPHAWIEAASAPPGVRIAGKDVDLFKLWQTVSQGGGSQKARCSPESTPH